MYEFSRKKLCKIFRKDMKIKSTSSVVEEYIFSSMTTNCNWRIWWSTLGVSRRPISSYFYWSSLFSRFNVTSPTGAAAAATVSVNLAIAAPGVYGSTAVGPTATEPAVRTYCLLLAKTVVINVAVDNDQYYLPELLSEIMPLVVSSSLYHIDNLSSLWMFTRFQHSQR